MKQNEFEQSQDSQQLHEKYQAESTEMPAPSLDKAILQAAHQATHQATHQAVDQDINQAAQAQSKAPQKRLEKRSWYVPAAYAAVLVLSLSVVMKLGFEAQESLPASAPVGMEMMESNSDSRLMMEEKALAVQKHMRVEQLRERQVKKSQQTKSMRRMPAQPRLSHADIATKRSALPQLDNAEQQQHIDELMLLFKAGKRDMLKIALFQYRKDYPYSILDDDFPEALRELEMKWGLEVKSAE